MLEIDGKWCTPPLSSGILPGIWRMGELSSGRVVERVLSIEDLHRASRVVVGNSVRGAMQVDAVIDASAESDLQTAFQCQLP